MRDIGENQYFYHNPSLSHSFTNERNIVAKFKRGDVVVHVSGWTGIVKNTMLDGHLIQIKDRDDERSYWDADAFRKVERVDSAGATDNFEYPSDAQLVHEAVDSGS